MEEFIPTFNEENNYLIKLDNFEDQIKVINELTKKYEELKKEIKENMLKIGKENNLTQVKWTTPKGIQITCSVGQKAEFEKETIKKFNESYLQEHYPDIYKECFIEIEREKCIKSASNDRLVITLPKEK